MKTLTIATVIAHNKANPELAHRYVRTDDMPVNHSICLSHEGIANYRVDNNILCVKASHADCNCTDEQFCYRCITNNTLDVPQLQGITLDTEVSVCSKYGK